MTLLAGGRLQGGHCEPTVLGMNNHMCATWLHLGMTFVSLGKLSDPLWGLQGGSKSFPDPPEAIQLALVPCSLNPKQGVSEEGTRGNKPD